MSVSDRCESKRGGKRCNNERYEYNDGSLNEHFCKDRKADTFYQVPVLAPELLVLFAVTDAMCFIDYCGFACLNEPQAGFSYCENRELTALPPASQ